MEMDLVTLFESKPIDESNDQSWSSIDVRKVQDSQASSDIDTWPMFDVGGCGNTKPDHREVLE